MCRDIILNNHIHIIKPICVHKKVRDADRSKNQIRDATHKIYTKSYGLLSSHPGIKHMYSKYGQIYKELGELYDTGPLNGSKPVNVAIMGTGRCYQEISEVYENQVNFIPVIQTSELRNHLFAVFTISTSGTSLHAVSYDHVICRDGIVHLEI